MITAGSSVTISSRLPVGRSIEILPRGAFMDLLPRGNPELSTPISNASCQLVTIYDRKLSEKTKKFPTNVTICRKSRSSYIPSPSSSPSTSHSHSPSPSSSLISSPAPSPSPYTKLNQTQKKTKSVSSMGQSRASLQESSNGALPRQHTCSEENSGLHFTTQRQVAACDSDCHVAGGNSQAVKGERRENGGAGLPRGNLGWQSSPYPSPSLSSSPPSPPTTTWTDVESWHPVDPIWEGDAEQVLETGNLSHLLSPAWRLMLLSDGSVTRHLNLLTGCHVAVDCVEMRHIGQNLEGLPAEVALVPGPRLQRQVYLRTKEGEILAYAASWWAAEEVDGYLKEVQEPMWVNFSRQRTELFRSVQRLYVGNSTPLEETFQIDGPFWARHYLFYHSGRPLTLIYEVFSRTLEKYLGPINS